MGDIAVFGQFCAEVISLYLYMLLWSYEEDIKQNFTLTIIIFSVIYAEYSIKTKRIGPTSTFSSVHPCHP